MHKKNLLAIVCSGLQMMQRFGKKLVGGTFASAWTALSSGLLRNLGPTVSKHREGNEIKS